MAPINSTKSAKSILPYSITDAIIIAKNITDVIKNGKTKNINPNFFMFFYFMKYKIKKYYSYKKISFDFYIYIG